MSHRVLIVANRTATHPGLLAAIRDRAAEHEAASFRLVVPATPHGLHRLVDPEVAGLDEARERLDLALPLLRAAAAGCPVDGAVGDANPLSAVADALHGDRFDEVIVSTLPPRLSRWLRVDLLSKVRALGVPTVHVSPDANDANEVTVPERLTVGAG